MEQDSKEAGLICAIDLGGTNLRAANIDREGRIHEPIRKPTPRSAQADEIVSYVAETVRECEASCADRGTQLQAVSIVVPGTVHVETGAVVNAPNLTCLQGYELRPALEQALESPVLIENDTNAAALGEMWQGAARGYRTIICLTLGTGVGGGIILDGELWRGADGTAGEIGHAAIEPLGGIKCKCGNIGCLEVYASGTAIVRMGREALAQDESSSLQSIPPDELTAEQVFRAGLEGDAIALAIFRSVGVYLGVAMSNLANIFNPEMIVVGGGVSAAWDLFGHYAHDEVMKRAFLVPARRCRIVRAQCGDDAGLLGAAWLAFQSGEGLR